MKPAHLAFAGALAAAALALPGASHAQSQIGHGRNFGVGLTAGFPNLGLGFNVFAQPNQSIQVDLTWSYRSDHGYFGARADYLFWMPRITSGGFGEVRWYLGPGLNVGVINGLYYGHDRYRSSGFFLGAEFPIGIGAQFRAVPIDLMVEAVPVLFLVDDIGPYLGLDIVGALHLRYYF